MIKKLGLLLTVLLVSPGAMLDAQQGPQQRIDAAFGRSAAAGIPVELLQSKVAEGRAKGVPLERIALAVERREAGLLRARDAMRGAPAVSGADLSIGADALERGVSPSVLRELASDAPAPKRAVAIAALTELVVSGNTPEQALQRVKAALRQGPEALSNLPARAAEARERRGPPSGANEGRPAGSGPPGTTPRDNRGGPPAGVPAGGRGKGRGNPNRP